jgi:hypothetical protein
MRLLFAAACLLLVAMALCIVRPHVRVHDPFIDKPFSDVGGNALCQRIEQEQAFVDCTIPVGPTGDAGPDGIIGPTGDQGQQGSYGHVGDAGDMGLVGTPGLDANKGTLMCLQDVCLTLDDLRAAKRL